MKTVDLVEKNDMSIAVIDENAIRDKIYVIRGMKVMMDFDLAEIYGYTTKAFNQQVNRNHDKFDEDFRFKLTKQEITEVSMSQNVTSIQLKGVKGGRSKPVYVFTEQGIYMLMTVLHGDLAVKQSKALIRTFKAMKDHIIENQDMVGQREFLKLSLKVSDNTRESLRMRQDLEKLNDDMNGVMDKLNDVVLKSEISPILLEMGKPEEKHEYLLLEGHPMKADLAYIEIYSNAKVSIHIIDDYISLKTLHLLKNVKNGVVVIVISDNVGRHLRASDLDEFRLECPEMQIRFIRNERVSHDRFIILDHGTEDERVFHCGPSSKDAGYRMGAIMELSETSIKEAFSAKISEMMEHPELVFA